MSNHYQNKRNNANTTNFQESAINSSSFDLSHKCKDILRIGRRELMTYEFVMSGDNVRLSSAHDLQFMPTVANMLPAMDVRVEHTFVPWRSVNADYVDTMSFDEGAAWNNTPYPTQTLGALMQGMFSFTDLDDTWHDLCDESTKEGIWSRVSSVLDVLYDVCGETFLSDYYSDLCHHVLTILGDWESLDADSRYIVLRDALYECVRDILGEGSYLDKLNCPILTKTNWNIICGASDNPKEAWNSFLSRIASTLPIFEMSLRALYADWYENVRDSALEPAASLPRYQKKTNSASSPRQILEMLLPRYAKLGRDIFTTANIDSPYRHVIAPIAPDTFSVNTTTGTNKLQDAIQVLTTMSNSTQKFDFPASTRGTLGNYLQTATQNNCIGIDLNVLKKARQAKDWLTRQHIYGDEYQDYVLAQYGVKISDARINKPVYLGGYSQEVNINTTTNPTATSEMPAGAKNCTMTSSGSDDTAFNFRVEENGIILTWAYIVPAVTYQPYDIRNTIKKGVDFPTPVFSNDSEEVSVACEIDRTLDSSYCYNPFGRHPYAHAWRSRVDENHSDFLLDLRPYTFLRFSCDPDQGVTEIPSLSAAFIHTHVNLDFMVDTDPFNRLAFGTFSHSFYVQRELPVVTDFC